MKSKIGSILTLIIGIVLIVGNSIWLFAFLLKLSEDTGLNLFNIFSVFVWNILFGAIYITTSKLMGNPEKVKIGAIISLLLSIILLVLDFTKTIFIISIVNLKFVGIFGIIAGAIGLFDSSK